MGTCTAESIAWRGACVLLSSSDFNMPDCTVFCDMLVAIVALCHLFEINNIKSHILCTDVDKGMP